MRWRIGSRGAQIFINCKGLFALYSFGFGLRQRSLLCFFVLDFVLVRRGTFIFLLTLLLSLCSRTTYALLLFQYVCCCRDHQIHQFQIVEAFDIRYGAFHIQLIILLELVLAQYIFTCLLKARFYFDLMLSMWVIVFPLNFLLRNSFFKIYDI